MSTDDYRPTPDQLAAYDRTLRGSLPHVDGAPSALARARRLVWAATEGGYGICTQTIIDIARELDECVDEEQLVALIRQNEQPIPPAHD